MPLLRQLANSANTAKNYFAIAHPSLTNHLEVAGGSNFGDSDNNSDWHNSSCLTNLSTGVANTDFPASPNVCPIWGSGTDASTCAIDCTNEVQCAPGSNAGELNIDGVRSRVWIQGRTAIVVLWDENDYSIAPSTNRVLTIVDSNFGPHGRSSNTSYNHFSLLESIESGLRLPCLNHACDTSVEVMSDLFVKDRNDHDE
jgi:hypothetical protein